MQSDYSLNSDADSDSSISDIQLTRLQDEILHQSKAVENFIKQSSQNEETSSLKVLKSLFSLFKSELSVNLSLREIVSSEKKKAGFYSKRISSFFEVLHEEGYTNLRKFEEIIDLIQQQNSHINHLTKKQKLCKTVLKEENQKGLMFQQRISELEERISIQNTNEEEQKILINNLTQKVNQLNSEIQNYNQEIIQKRDKILELEQIAHDLEMKIKEQEKERIDLVSHYESEISIQKSHLNESRMIFFNQVSSFQKEIAELKTMNSEQQKKFEHQTSEFNSQYFNDIEIIKKECHNKIMELAQEKESKENILKQEIDSQKVQIESFMKSLNENENLLKQKNFELQELNTKFINLENSEKQLKETNSNQQLKIKRFTKKQKIAQIQLSDTIENHDKEIQTVQANFELEKKRIISELENEWRLKFQNIEATLREMRKSNDEQKVENANLKELIRKLSFNLQQEEAENAKIYAALKVRRLKHVGKTKGKVRRSISIKQQDKLGLKDHDFVVDDFSSSSSISFTQPDLSSPSEV